MIQFQLVVPAYNEAENLSLLINRFIRAAQSLKLTENEVQLILVNNGSIDHSAEMIDALKSDLQKMKWLEFVNIKINEGYGSGVWQGLQSSKADFVGWSHADLQCDPLEALKAFQRLKQKPATENWIIKGIRTDRDLKSVFVSRFFELLASAVLGFSFYEINAMPKVFHRRLLLKITNPPKDFAFDLYVLFKALQANYQVDTITVQFPNRVHGVSSWANHFTSRYRTFLKMIKYIFTLKKDRHP